MTRLVSVLEDFLLFNAGAKTEQGHVRNTIWRVIHEGESPYIYAALTLDLYA